MSQTSIERLRAYLSELPPQAQAMLMREFERAVVRGDEASIANLVLDELRKIVRGSGEEAAAAPRGEEPARLVFNGLGPFLIDGNAAGRPGQIRRESLLPLWHWTVREGAPDEARAFEAALATAEVATSPSEIDKRVHQMQFAIAAAIDRLIGAADNRRALARIGAPSVVEDIVAIGCALQAREALAALNGRLASYLRVFGDSQVASVQGSLNVPALQTRDTLPFALSLVMSRLAAPWQIIRLAIAVAASDDEGRVAATPYGIAVTMALHDLACIAAALRADIKRGRFDNVSDYLKTVHDGVRGLRTELDIRTDSLWGRQLASIRVEISNALQSEIESVPGRVRRLLRQRADKDITANTRLDPGEIDETAALIDFVAVCRTYASELAINEVTLRTFSELQHYVEHSTEALVDSLRVGPESKALAFRQMQVRAAIRFSEALFGRDYAALMTRAADSALAGERKPARAG